jgi:hypothetical protein
MTYQFLLLPVGPVPPAGGPVRDEFLRSSGTRALQGAAADFVAGTNALRLDHLPAEDFFMEEPLSPQAAEDHRLEWSRIRASIHGDDLSRQRDLVNRAVKQAVRALNHLEDTELAEDAHLWVHRTVRLRSGLYGCRLWVEKEEVWSDCAVRVSHERWGVSVEMTAVWNCSICGERFDSCSHDPDAVYEVVVARPTGGSCSVCVEFDCDHQDGAVIRASPFPVAASISAGAVAVVDRPRYPDARPTRVTLPIAPGSEVYRRALERNLNCDLCMKPCPGWRYRDPN